MTDFRLRDIAEHLASRDRARRLRERVLAALEQSQQKVVIDLANVRSISDSFADELFAVLAQTRGDVWFQTHIDVVGASDVVRGSIVRAIRARLHRDTQSRETPAFQGYTLAPPPEQLSSES